MGARKKAKASQSPVKKKPAAKAKPAAKRAPAKKKPASKAKPAAKRAPVEKKPAVKAKPTPKKTAAKTKPAPTQKRAPAKVVPKAAAKFTAPKRTSVAPSAKAALNVLAQKKAIAATLSPSTENGKAIVDAYMRDVDHPFKAEMEAVRRIILGASPKLSERIKWNAPSFHYKEDLGAFNPRATEYAHLILLFPGGAGMDDDSGLLEGKHKDRREAKFRNLADVEAKRPALERLVKRWVELRGG
jgi:hypothetical protein